MLTYLTLQNPVVSSSPARRELIAPLNLYDRSDQLPRGYHDVATAIVVRVICMVAASRRQTIMRTEQWMRRTTRSSNSQHPTSTSVIVRSTAG